jgi:hypothetical protein
MRDLLDYMIKILQSIQGKDIAKPALPGRIQPGVAAVFQVFALPVPPAPGDL